ncbi:unnamed protein product, partial [Vitis vinifera]
MTKKQKSLNYKIWRESSYDFWRDECETERKSGPRFQFQQPLATEDPPSKLIGQFLHKQKALGDFSLDMDMEMEELRNERKKPPTPESTMHPKMSSMEMKLSFQHLTTGAAEMISCDNPDGEVLRCTSNMEFQRKSSLLRNKTKSRLADGPEYVMKSGLLPKTRLFPKSGVFKSGLLGISEEEEEDPETKSNALKYLNHENVSAWNMKRLMHMVRHESLATLDEQIHGSTHEDEPATQIKSEDDAKIAARKIFHNVAKPNCKFIYLEDIMRFMREDEALRTMSLFDQGASHSEKISKSALKNWVVNAFRERRALALTLNDTKTAVNKLHQMVNVLLLVVFIFGNTCKNIFEAIIFVFVMHPFDVGDRCEIDGVQMVVEEMNILTTVFLRADNMKIVFPNSTLATRPIGNFYRSPDMGDAVEFLVHIATPAEKIAMIRQRILSYMERKKDHWAPSPMVIIKDLEGLNQLRMAVWMGHKINHQNMGERWTRRYLLIDEIVKILREVDIEYRMIPLDINVRSMPKPSPVTSTRLPPSWTASGGR